MEAPAATPPPAAEYLRTRAAFIGPGWWLPWIGVLAYGSAGAMGVRLAARYGGGFGSPGDPHPWYFLRTDFVAGVCMAAGIVVCLAIAAVTWRRYPGNTRALLWVNVLWSGGGAWKAFLIALCTRHLFDPARAEATRWPTFNSYIGDPLIWAGQVAIWIGAIAFASWPGARAAIARRRV